MILHTINKSLQHSAIESCLRVASNGSAIILIEDGVYGAVAPSPLEEVMDRFELYVLEADAKARGINDKLIPGIKCVDYQGFVVLATECDSVQSWF